MKSNTSGRVRSIFVHLVLIFLSFLCLFFFYILIVNATRSHADLQKGFSALPGKYFLENLKNVANDGSFPMFRGILNSVVVSSCSAALCTYFSSYRASFPHSPVLFPSGNSSAFALLPVLWILLSLFCPQNIRLHPAPA